MSLELTILGFNSAVPTAHSHPTAQLLNISERYFLIDCGEGTQVQLRRSKARFSKINHIFISHLHGDHVFGLVGLISTFQLLGRENPMTIYGPVGIKEFIKVQLKCTQSICSFPLNFVEIGTKESVKIFEDEKVEVFTIPLKHRIYTNGYLFREKPKQRKLLMSAVEEFPEIEMCDYNHIKNGRDFILKSGEVIPNDYLTLPPDHSVSYAFCSDTVYKPDIVDIIKNVDLLYHESTFLEELLDLAKKTGHSTALQAGKIAKQAQVGKLILGHFSNRYPDYQVFADEAKQEFENTVVPTILEVYKV